MKPTEGAVNPEGFSDTPLSTPLVFPEPPMGAGHAWRCEHRRVVRLSRGGGNIIFYAWCQDCGSVRVRDGKKIWPKDVEPPVSLAKAPGDSHTWIYPVRDGWRGDQAGAIKHGLVDAGDAKSGASLRAAADKLPDVRAEEAAAADAVVVGDVESFQEQAGPLDASEREQVARDIGWVKRAVTPILMQLLQRQVSHQGIVMALTHLAAHHALHDGAAEHDFLAVARDAWSRSVEQHEDCES